MTASALPPDRPGVQHRRWSAATPMPSPDAPGMIVLWNDWRPIGHVLRLADGSIRQQLPDPGMIDEPRPVDAPATETISVVICTRDRPDDIAHCLASLAQQSRTPDQIVVVDNASRDDRTRQAALAAGVIYLREDREGLDFARNAGVAASTGDLVLFTDDDVLLDRDWVARMAAAFDDPDIGAVTGLVLPAELASDAQLYFESHWGFGQGYVLRDVTPAEFDRHPPRIAFPAWDLGAGASMGFRRAVFADAGLFDERLGAGQSGCSDDSEYWYRLLHRGWRLRYDPRIVAHHVHRRDEAGLSRQIHQYMRGHVAALLIQYDRTGRPGNLWRALWDLPLLYARRWLRRAIGRRADAADRYLDREIAGYFSGILFYLRNRGHRA